MDDEITRIKKQLKTMSVNIGFIADELDRLSRNKVLDYESNRLLNILFKEISGHEYILKFLSGFYKNEGFDVNQIDCKTPVSVDHINNNEMKGLSLK